MDFVIDTVGDTAEEKTPYGPVSSFLTELFSGLEEPCKQKPTVPKSKNALLEEILDDLKRPHAKLHKKKKSEKVEAFKSIDRQEVQKALAKSILTPEFEKLHVVPPFEVSERKLKQQRKKEREKTKGDKWFGLPATEMTEEVKQDLQVLQMRSVLDPKHFYKKNDLKVLPKYFQIGKVMDSPIDFYNDRIPKKQRKKTLVDELLADAQFQKYNKRKYKEIIEDKQKTHYKAWRQAKRLKKKK
ncbi:deoxynucleotidyltransferase terminal-interacting protein 2 [Leptinotarsa decemlineata]|uniref:deoxynucleotidyltransferase terminal-interacting protein 2 n=1 Tax=Leptinotarsa decemlineata TaxID=7539 RepID=UPI003D3085B5